MRRFFSSETPFEDIYEIPIGCRVTFDKFGKKSLEPVFDILASAERELYNSPKTDKNWSNQFFEDTKSIFKKKSVGVKNIILELSGGLDSSFLAVCLSKSKMDGANIRAIHRYSRDAFVGDEEKYANAITKFCSIPLYKLYITDLPPFKESQFEVLPNLPSTAFNFLAGDMALNSFAKAIDAQYLLCNGHGGDSLFFSTPPMEAFSDAFWSGKFSLGLKNFFNLNQLSSRGYTMQIIDFFRNSLTYLKKQPLDIFNSFPKNNFVIPKIGKSFELHPLFLKKFKQRILPGKKSQLSYYYMTLGSAQRPLPLFFPFLETILAAHAFKIPTYKSFNHQFNRLPLRKLLSEISEPRFACRTTKGLALGLFFKGVKENYAAILEKCMYGSLQKLGFFDRNQLCQAVYHLREGMTGDIWVINNIYCAELFLNARRF